MGFFVDLLNLCGIIIIMIDIRNCVGKRIVFSSAKAEPTLSEGTVSSVVGETVLIEGVWYKRDSITVMHVLSNGINESNNGGESLING